MGGSAATGFVTRGDHRTSVDPWRPRPADVIGSVALRIPYRAARCVSLLREPPLFAWFVGSIVLVGLWNIDRRRRSAPVARVAIRLRRPRTPLLSWLSGPDQAAGGQ